MALTGAEKASRYYRRHRPSILAERRRRWRTDARRRNYTVTHKRMSRWADRWLAEWQRGHATAGACATVDTFAPRRS